MGEGADTGSDWIFPRADQSAPSPYSRKAYVGRWLRLVVQTLPSRPTPPRAFRWREFLLWLFRAKVAKTARIRPSVKIVRPWLLGARAVVTKDMPPNVVVAGNPARGVKPRLMHWPDGKQGGPPTHKLTTPTDGGPD